MISLGIAATIASIASLVLADKVLPGTVASTTEASAPKTLIKPSNLSK